MVRELFITVYLAVFQMVFNICKLFPQKKKTVFVTSFGDNVFYVANELAKAENNPIVILKEKRCSVDFSSISNTKERSLETKNFVEFVQSIYHLATAKQILVDNYFGFLSVTRFKPNVTCIQLWHAAGAVKQFGLLDPSNHTRSKRSHKRFLEVYSRFHYVVVGSEKMASIFRKSFGLSNNNILRTGVPRTDMFYDKAYMEVTKKMLQRQIPEIINKKVILYAPTYRDEQLYVNEITLDLALMRQQLEDDYVLLLKLHPAVSGNIDNPFPEFIVNVSNGFQMNDLLIVTDYLITDYSSIPFEFSLLKKPMIFYAYDLDDYNQSRGFYEDYETSIPGPLVMNTTEIIDAILANNFDQQKIQHYAQQWNQYSKGQSSINLVMTMTDKESKVKINEVQ